MRPLDGDSLRQLRRERHGLNYGWQLSQAEVDRLTSEWEPRVQPDAKDSSERFALALPDGSTTGVDGPRWLFHLLGLCHRASHIGLASPNGLVLLQRRSPWKADWPDAWDMAVAGHVPQWPDGSEMTFEEGATKEMEEEVGLPTSDLPDLLREGRLVPVGSPYFSYETDPNRNPPFHNAESRQIYAATLTEAGMARLAPDPEELSGLLWCTPEQAWDLLAREPVAGGLRYSLPRYLDWLAQARQGGSVG